MKLINKLTTLIGFFAISAVSSQAATITWSAVSSATDTDISTTGTLLEAANFGGSTVAANGVSFTGVTFPATLSNLTQNYNSNGTWTSPGLGGSIDSIFTTYGSVSTLTGLGLTNLTDGQEYEIQVFAYASGGAGARTLTFSDLASPTPNTIAVTYVDASIVTGTFTADGTSQAMNWVESTGSNFVSGYQLRAVPEPSAFALIAGCFGLTCVMLRRRS